ncbi:MAG: PKD domain-containing protein [Flavobacteriales bacterium]|nr:PKD domain-containing protein [Flavobacteriales bacterium]
MKVIISSIIGLFIGVTGYSQDTAKVLFIGNSYTYVNDMPTMIANIATSFDDVLIKDSQTPGGMTLNGHASNTLTYSKINSKNWDHVVLQAQSQEPSFPDSQVDTETIPYAMQMADSVYANHYCSKVMMFMTWGRENGDPQWGPISTFNGMNTRLRNAYVRMADSVQGSVSPVGSAWRVVRELDPSIQLYSGDGSHPSVAGTYLAACTFYASIFQKSPVGTTFESSLTPAVAAILQNAADITVFDSLDTWNIAPMSEFTSADFAFTNNDPSVDFSNESDHATSYVWSFGDGETSVDENPTHSYAASGTYTVELIANSPCDSDTIAYDLDIISLSLNSLESNGFVLENNQNGLFSIVSDAQLIAGTILSLDGKQLDIEMKNNSFDLSNVVSGLYVIQIQTAEGYASFKVRR